MLLSLRRKKKISLTKGVLSDKVIDFTNEPSMWRSFLKNAFVNNGDIQPVRYQLNRYDNNTYCNFYGDSFVCRFSFLTE